MTIRTRPRVLGRADRPALRALLSDNPIVNCVVQAQMDAAAGNACGSIGGTMWGIDDPTGRGLRVAAFVGGNLIPIGFDVDGLTDLAIGIRRTPRTCSSIVGTVEAVGVLWPLLSKGWGRARAVRARQPVLVADRPSPVEPDRLVRIVRPSDVRAFEAAAVHMFAEELGVQPSALDGGVSYRRRLDELIRAGRAFARFDSAGRVEFKAEIGALSSATAQIQGVWVRPDLRGKGMGTACMAAALDHALAFAPCVSLYVNDYNRPARKVYDRVGFRQIDIFTTVLF